MLPTALLVVEPGNGPYQHVATKEDVPAQSDMAVEGGGGADGVQFEVSCVQRDKLEEQVDPGRLLEHLSHMAEPPLQGDEFCSAAPL